MKSAKRTRVAAAALLSASVGALLWAGAAQAQTAADEVAVSDIVVTGFRASIANALVQKRNETAAVDTILAEDIGKFPDTNLAESMQRIPGVALARGDGGEGKQISVRGLGPQFTRVRINGMEGASQTGASDIFGAGNSGRSFDFNTFPSEIFSALTARKTPSADIEEGSLGATVDLTAPKPLDYRTDQVLSLSARAVYNELSESFDPRYSILAAKKFADGKFGVLASFAYQDRDLREVGYSAVDILPTNVNGFNAIVRDTNGNPIILPGGAVKREVQPFCTPVGWTPPTAGERIISPDPAEHGAKGATTANCSTGNPRTGTIAAYNTIYNLRRADAATTPGSGAFLPRIPRYVNSEQDAERMGGSLTFQWKPGDDTNITLDFLHSRFDVERRDNYIAGLSFARSVTDNGQPMVSVKDIEFDDNGSIVYGLFDGVDIRSEGLVDRFVSEFNQANLNFEHHLTDKLKVNLFVGKSRSTYKGVLRLQTYIDIIDADDFSIDFRDGGSTPIISFGADVSNPANFAYGPAVAGNVTGGFSFQGKPSKNTTENTTVNLDWEYAFNDALTFKFGAQSRISDFSSYNLNPIPGTTATQALPAGTTLASITRTIDGLDDLWGRGAPASWVAVDPWKWAEMTDFENRKYCGIECGAGSSGVREEVKSAYGMVTFDAPDLLPIPVRGDVGVRYVNTDMHTFGYIAVTAPAGSPYPTVGRRGDVDRAYNDLLPSANVVFEFTPTLLGRVSAAKVMSRPELGNLTPTSGITATTRTGNVNNPFLDPIRATTYDAALEWYFKPGSLLSVGVFHKDIETFIQRQTEIIPFRDLGLPDALLDGTNTAPTELFTVGRLLNTPGGPLTGVEVNAQVQLDFLPGFWSNFGVLANYTQVKSEIEYILSPTVSVKDDLVGLSKNTASGTLYYEDDKWSVRTTASYRSDFILATLGSNGSDIRANDATLYVDASAQYNLTDNVKLIVELQNITDEQNRLFIDSTRNDTLFETRVGRTITIGAMARF